VDAAVPAAAVLGAVVPAAWANAGRRAPWLNAEVPWARVDVVVPAAWVDAEATAGDRIPTISRPLGPQSVVRESWCSPSSDFVKFGMNFVFAATKLGPGGWVWYGSLVCATCETADSGPFAHSTHLRRAGGCTRQDRPDKRRTNVNYRWELRRK